MYSGDYNNNKKSNNQPFKNKKPVKKFQQQPLQDGYVQCPFNRNHTMPEKKLAWHIVKCPDKQHFSQCQYCQKYYYKPKIAIHEETCQGKIRHQRDINQKAQQTMQNLSEQMQAWEQSYNQDNNYMSESNPRRRANNQQNSLQNQSSMMNLSSSNDQISFIEKRLDKQNQLKQNQNQNKNAQILQSDSSDDSQDYNNQKSFQQIQNKYTNSISGQNQQLSQINKSNSCSDSYSDSSSVYQKESQIQKKIKNNNKIRQQKNLKNKINFQNMLQQNYQQDREISSNSNDLSDNQSFSSQQDEIQQNEHNNNQIISKNRNFVQKSINLNSSCSSESDSDYEQQNNNYNKMKKIVDQKNVQLQKQQSSSLKQQLPVQQLSKQSSYQNQHQNKNYNNNQFINHKGSDEDEEEEKEKYQNYRGNNNIYSDQSDDYQNQSQDQQFYDSQELSYQNQNRSYNTQNQNQSGYIKQKNQYINNQNNNTYKNGQNNSRFQYNINQERQNSSNYNNQKNYDRSKNYYNNNNNYNYKNNYQKQQFNKNYSNYNNDKNKNNSINSSFQSQNQSQNYNQSLNQSQQQGYMINNISLSLIKPQSQSQVSSKMSFYKKKKQYEQQQDFSKYIENDQSQSNIDMKDMENILDLIEKDEEENFHNKNGYCVLELKLENIYINENKQIKIGSNLVIGQNLKKIDMLRNITVYDDGPYTRSPEILEKSIQIEQQKQTLTNHKIHSVIQQNDEKSTEIQNNSNSGSNFVNNHNNIENVQQFRQSYTHFSLHSNLNQPSKIDHNQSSINDNNSDFKENSYNNFEDDQEQLLKQQNCSKLQDKKSILHKKLNQNQKNQSQLQQNENNELQTKQQNQNNSTQITTEERNKFKADIWLLAVLYYKLITGRYPFQGHISYKVLEEIKNKTEIFQHSDQISQYSKEFLELVLIKGKNVEERPDWVEIYNLSLFKQDEMPLNTPFYDFKSLQNSSVYNAQIRQNSIEFYQNLEEYKPKINYFQKKQSQFSVINKILPSPTSQISQELNFNQLKEQIESEEAHKQMENGSLQKYLDFRNKLFHFHKTITYLQKAQINEKQIAPQKIIPGLENFKTAIFLLQKMIYLNLKQLYSHLFENNNKFNLIPQLFEEIIKSEAYSKFTEVIKFELDYIQKQLEISIAYLYPILKTTKQILNANNNLSQTLSQKEKLEKLEDFEFILNQEQQQQFLSYFLDYFKNFKENLEQFTIPSLSKHKSSMDSFQTPAFSCDENEFNIKLEEIQNEKIQKYEQNNISFKNLTIILNLINTCINFQFAAQDYQFQITNQDYYHRDTEIYQKISFSLQSMQ
ncbi:Protein kinase-like domain [Pseudocohnilembus persalinus]|uniref:Protein kinase-like domain n=1 Tax=Pseudocohnilembus persalinus TaxID=266149 RepID=A0A0V0R6A1_PSEPJ|nr:Protein kinase-like domain [Pseudocohnilembus persalinus]|eukprot:KRX09888.1 Protein kinase-like domain [Pseudocohnilembus persalinus]